MNPAVDIQSLDPLVHAPARLAILTVLSLVDEADFRYLLYATGLTKGNLSAHLSKLEEAGYVDIEKTFRGKLPLTLCRLTPQGQRALEAYRRTMRAILDLGEAAEAQDRSSPQGGSREPH